MNYRDADRSAKENLFRFYLVVIHVVEAPAIARVPILNTTTMVYLKNGNYKISGVRFDHFKNVLKSSIKSHLMTCIKNA